MAETPGVLSPRSPWNSFRAGVWLGWQIESNWADPWVFTIYAVLRPVSLAGILVVMYAAIGRGSFDSPVFTSMYLGNAFYIYVGAITSGMGWAVVQDREHYRTLKSIYSAPVIVPFYLIGRGVARLVTASFSVVVILALGVIVLGLGIASPATVEWPLLCAGLALGVMTLALMGLAVAGILLLTGNESWALGDLLAGALFLFSGAVFPLDVLPSALRPIGLVLPMTYWLEVVRRALIEGNRAATFAAWSDESLLALLAALTAATAVVAVTLFRACERIARQRGLIDRTSHY